MSLAAIFALKLVITPLLVGAASLPLLGPRLAGLIAPFLLYATVLATFAHRVQGAAPAVGVLRGLLLGLFAFAAFLAAIVVALALQGASLALVRRLRIA